jgi:hypothetical protein
MRYTKEKRVFMVTKYHRFQSSLKVQQAWDKKYPGEKSPTARTILANVKKFKETGSIQDLPHIFTKVNEQRESAKKQLIDLIHEFPKLSVRKAASAVGLNRETVRVFLKEDLHLKPYKEQEYHQLLPADHDKRVEFANWVLSLPPEALLCFIMSDEAYFYLTPPINKQSDRIWSATKPLESIQRPLQDERVLVWCGMSASKIYGPYFFEDTVNQHNYLYMLQQSFWKQHRRVENYQNYYFQQDGATPHKANRVQDYLKSKFGDFFIDKTKWPPRSPDLNACDFFLWGYLKERAYKPLPNTIHDLKENIKREIKNIDEKILHSCFKNVSNRCSLILSAEGVHIEDK